MMQKLIVEGKQQRYIDLTLAEEVEVNRRVSEGERQAQEEADKRQERQLALERLRANGQYADLLTVLGLTEANTNKNHNL